MSDEKIWSKIHKERMEELEHFEAIGPLMLNDKGKDRMIFLLEEDRKERKVKNEMGGRP